MTRIALTALALLAVVGCGACIRNQETSFFHNFSMRTLVENYKSHAALDCGPVSGGGGGSTFGIAAVGGGFPRSEYHSHKGDAYFCKLNSSGALDEAALIEGLARDVESAITSSGAKLVDRQTHGPTNILLNYTSGNAKGHIEISVKRFSGDQYNLLADLEESGKSRWW